MKASSSSTAGFVRSKTARGVTSRLADRAPYLERIDPLVDEMTKEFGPSVLPSAREVPDASLTRPVIATRSCRNCGE